MIILMFLAGTAKKMRTRFIAVLFCCLLTVGESESKSSIAGQNVTLTCTYDIRKHGRVAACWGRGDLLMFGCKDQIVATDGLRVTQQSPKYKLLGRLTNGDVSLTILNVKKEDAGKYACRVEVFGMFNDEKHNFELIIKDAPQTTTLQTFTYAKSISTPDATKTPNQIQVTSSEGLQTSSSSISFKTEKRDVPAWGVAMGVLFGLILLGAAIIIIISRRKRRLNKIHQQHPSVHSVHFSSTSSSSHHEAETADNIYQMDTNEYDTIYPEASTTYALPLRRGLT
ncbi:T-cell immunoglobulin and mucin domain-containing protein 4-like isoform X4 [Syngnathus acus]|uniref:T-cell immunoglobulin and mucin domain-containing protein 4-like isoform X4 n=1 Tax=Syngnathus acus TaxID=161584 RepID=UPI001885DEAC|nr:T-cell immunoglobulin and mucin domain-containing protein 4-like isoform X4 [Syngnathus acus]